MLFKSLMLSQLSDISLTIYRVGGQVEFAFISCVSTLFYCLFYKCVLSKMLKPKVYSIHWFQRMSVGSPVCLPPTTSWFLVIGANGVWPNA
jgi:hypothetical protein